MRRSSSAADRRRAAASTRLRGRPAANSAPAPGPRPLMPRRAGPHSIPQSVDRGLRRAVHGWWMPGCAVWGCSVQGSGEFGQPAKLPQSEFSALHEISRLDLACRTSEHAHAQLEEISIANMGFNLQLLPGLARGARVWQRPPKAALVKLESLHNKYCVSCTVRI